MILNFLSAIRSKNLKKFGAESPLRLMDKAWNEYIYIYISFTQRNLQKKIGGVRKISKKWNEIKIGFKFSFKYKNERNTIMKVENIMMFIEINSHNFWI